MSSRIDRVGKLIELADIELDKAAKMLAAVQEQLTRELSQLEALEAYEKEYSDQPAKQSESMTLIALQTRHAFGEKLRQAVVSQSFQVGQLENTIENARDNWLEKRKELKSLQALQEKFKQSQQVQLDRQEQRMLDDLAAQGVMKNKKTDGKW